MRLIGRRWFRYCRGRAQGETLKARGIECRLWGGGLNHRGRDEIDKAMIRQEGKMKGGVVGGFAG